MLLGVRAGAIKGSIDKLRQEQARQGLGLRQDISAGCSAWNTISTKPKRHTSVAMQRVRRKI